MGLGEQRCKGRVFIDEKGVPFRVDVEDCPKIFHAPTKEGVMKWRWYPPRANRQKVKAQTLIIIRYRVDRN